MKGFVTEEGISTSEYIRFRLRRRDSSRSAKELMKLVPFWSGIVLEVGCGPGLLLNELHKRLFSPLFLLGTDIDREMVKFANKFSISNGYKIHYISNSTGSLPIKNEKVNILICDSSFHHFEYPKEMLLEFIRVVKSNGTIIIADINPKSIYAIVMEYFYSILKLIGIKKNEATGFLISKQKSIDIDAFGRLFREAGINNWTYHKKRMCYWITINKPG